MITQSEDLTDRDFKFSPSGRESKKDAPELPAQNLMSHLQEIRSRDLRHSYQDNRQQGTPEAKSSIDDHRSSHSIKLDDKHRENQNPNLPQGYSKALSHHAFSNKKESFDNFGSHQSRGFASEVKVPDQGQEFNQIFNPFANIENIFSVTQQRNPNPNTEFGASESRTQGSFRKQGGYQSPRSEKKQMSDNE